MKYNPWKGCGCQYCRHWPPSKIKGFEKREAHRKFRRLSKKALIDLNDDKIFVHTGYKT